MQNHFNLTTQINNLWFLGFNITSYSGLVAICFGLFAVAFAFEGFTCIRVIFKQKANINPLKYGQDERRHIVNVNDETPLLSSLTLPISWDIVKKRKIIYHILEATCFAIQLTVGYMMMLAVMSFNGFLLISIILGSTFGRYLLTAMLPSTSLDVKIDEQRQINSIIEEYNREEERERPSTSSQGPSAAVYHASYGAVNT